MADSNASDDLRSRRAAMLQVLDRQKQDLADMYRAGVMFTEGAPFPGRGPLVGHIVRELRNGLPRAFMRSKPKPRLDHHRHLQRIYNDWNPVSQALERSQATIGTQPDVAVPWKVASALNTLILEDQSVKTSIERRFLEMCTVVNREATPWRGNNSLADRWARIETDHIAHVSVNDADIVAHDFFNELESIILNVFDYAPDREKRVIASALDATPNTIKSALDELITLHDFFTFYGNLISRNCFQP